MKKDYRMYVDEEGFPRMEFEAESHKRELVGLFLMMDVGSFIKGCEELIEKTKEILNGIHVNFTGTGNLFTISISKEQTTITNAFDDEETYSLFTQEFLTFLDEWHALIVAK